MAIMEKKIIVVGSTNLDMVIQAQKIPMPGETVLGGKFYMNPGGKGANQAMAITKLGGDILFISKIGDDLLGKKSTKLLGTVGLDVRGIILDEDEPSGVALVTIDKKGENSITVSPGANQCLTPQDVLNIIKKVEGVEIVLMQLEIPFETVKSVAEYAKSQGIKLILDPAPINERVFELFSLIDIITPNIQEAESLAAMKITNVEDAHNAAGIIADRGIENIVITIGDMGAIVLEKGVFTHVPAPKVEVKDTTAAGDAFDGALAVGLSEGKSLVDSVRFACKVASITVTRFGAQLAIPDREELKNVD